MSKAARAARRKNSKKAKGLATGPRTPEGKEAASRNSWKHGQRAASIFTSIGKPCLSSCAKFTTCELVASGQAGPGMECPDGDYIISAFKALVKAIKNKDYDDINELIAFEISSNLAIVNQLKTYLYKSPVL